MAGAAARLLLSSRVGQCGAALELQVLLARGGRIAERTMNKPTVYLDTSIISAYWDKAKDVSAAARREKTRDWWEYERRYFELWTSMGAENELHTGRFPHQIECLRMVRRRRHLVIDRTVDDLVDELLALRIVPETRPGDAVQMAVSAAHEMDYLLTWNYAHLANPIAQERLRAVSLKRRLRVPLLVSPESIPSIRLGLTIRRRD